MFFKFIKKLSHDSFVIHTLHTHKNLEEMLMYVLAYSSRIDIHKAKLSNFNSILSSTKT